MPINRYRIISIEKTAEDVKIFRMEPIDGRLLSYKPGQFAFIHLLDSEGRTTLKRPYSIASAPHAPYLEFCIKIINGAMTSQLEKLDQGATVGIEGPAGHFFYGDQRNVGLVASGTGVAPMIGILRDIAEKKLEGNFILFYSTKTLDSMVYQHEFENIQKINPNIKIVITLTREQPVGWKGELGRINQEMITKHVIDPKNMDWWMCGQMEMIKAMKAILVELCIDLKRVKMEGWG
ncbi:Sulfhydrogenase 2 subunit gamma [Candidatus Bilamarchaeum dharawalense]|uniref:Sulfhydrogenase 2 subunit gamma n=1 Tax=Candidatus Bilamarchaeum dharawalense TaxID=2885759 RepID=A0A5E4LNL5_9ARCH|nr:Sulfhydrogenase 2 subunit gamma [Candidatus Bilamarchaeum dharawalense]